MHVQARRERAGYGSKSDDRGNYTISGLEPGDYEIRLISETLPLPTLTGSATVVAGREARVDFAVPDPATFDFHAVRIVATLDDGRPAAGFSLYLSEAWTGSGRDQRSVSPLACFESKELSTGFFPAYSGTDAVRWANHQ